MYRVEYILPDTTREYRTVYANDLNHACIIARKIADKSNWRVGIVQPYYQ